MSLYDDFLEVMDHGEQIEACQFDRDEDILYGNAAVAALCQPNKYPTGTVVWTKQYLYIAMEYDGNRWIDVFVRNPG
jgi:hypothetical protein